jgi:hypothetical protein
MVSKVVRIASQQEAARRGRKQSRFNGQRHDQERNAGGGRHRHGKQARQQDEQQTRQEEVKFVMDDEPFGRQPKPVTVLISGEQIDVDYWYRDLRRRAEFKGDATGDIAHVTGVDKGASCFIIYPRAVND